MQAPRPPGGRLVGDQTGGGAGTEPPGLTAGGRAGAAGERATPAAQEGSRGRERGRGARGGPGLLLQSQATRRAGGGRGGKRRVGFPRQEESPKPRRGTRCAVTAGNGAVAARGASVAHRREGQAGSAPTGRWPVRDRGLVQGSQAGLPVTLPHADRTPVRGQMETWGTGTGGQRPAGASPQLGPRRGPRPRRRPRPESCHGERPARQHPSASGHHPPRALSPPAALFFPQVCSTPSLGHRGLRGGLGFVPVPTAQVGQGRDGGPLAPAAACALVLR